MANKLQSLIGTFSSLWLCRYNWFRGWWYIHRYSKAIYVFRLYRKVYRYLSIGTLFWQIFHYYQQLVFYSCVNDFVTRKHSCSCNNDVKVLWVLWQETQRRNFCVSYASNIQNHNCRLLLTLVAVRPPVLRAKILRSLPSRTNSSSCWISSTRGPGGFQNGLGAFPAQRAPVDLDAVRGGCGRKVAGGGRLAASKLEEDRLFRDIWSTASLSMEAWTIRTLRGA